MLKNIVKTSAVLGAAFLFVACSAGGKGKFVAACTDSLLNEVGSKDEAKVACTCAHKRLSEELSSKQLAMATDVVALKSRNDLREYSQKHKGADWVSERVQGAMKSCAGGGF